MAYASLRVQIEIYAAPLHGTERDVFEQSVRCFSLCTSEMDIPYPLAPINIILSKNDKYGINLIPSVYAGVYPFPFPDPPISH